MAAQQEALLQQMQDQIAQMQPELAVSATGATTTTTAAAATVAPEALPPPGGGAGHDGFPLLAPVFALSPALVSAGAFLNL
jgi:hypothetical protein